MPNRWRNGGGGGGGGGNGRQGSGTTSTGSPAPTLAHRQIQQQQSALQKQLDDARRREDQLRRENLRLQREQGASRVGSGGVDEMEEDAMDDDDPQELSQEERRRRIDDIKAGIPYITSRFGETSEELERARADLASLERASRDAKPYRTHRALLERRKGRLEKQQEKGKEEADELLIQVEKLQARLNEVNRANDEREREIAAVDEELRDLLKRAIAEGEGDGQATQTALAATTIDPSAAWQTVSSTIESLAAKPGVPRDWAAQLGQLLEQLRVAASAVHQRATTAAGAAETAAAAAAGSNEPPHPLTPSSPPAPHVTPLQHDAQPNATAAATPAPAAAAAATPTTGNLGGAALSDKGDDGKSGGKPAEPPAVPEARDSDLESVSDDDMASVGGGRV